MACLASHTISPTIKRQQCRNSSPPFSHPCPWRQGLFSDQCGVLYSRQQGCRDQYAYHMPGGRAVQRRYFQSVNRPIEDDRKRGTWVGGLLAKKGTWGWELAWRMKARVE
jgi:hypothetical protein